MGDRRADWWYVAEQEATEDLIAALEARAARSRAIVQANDLATVGRPGPRWDGAEPATLERVLFHLVQEHARHLGHLDVVAELGGGPVGEYHRPGSGTRKRIGLRHTLRLPIGFRS